MGAEIRYHPNPVLKDKLEDTSRMVETRQYRQAEISDQDPPLLRLVMSLPLMGLFLEWLLPLQPLATTDSNHILMNTFYALTAVLLLSGVFLPRWYVHLPIYLLAIETAWAFVFGQALSFKWIVSSFALLKEDMEILIDTGHFTSLSSESRTLILLVGWGLLVYSVQSLALTRRSILLFATATIIYLLCLEAFAGLYIYEDMVRTGLLFLLLQGIAHLSRLRGNASDEALTGKVFGTWLLVLIVGCAMIISSAWFTGNVTHPKQAQRVSLQSVVERFEAWAQDGVEQPQRGAVTGYNLNDELHDMGMPLVPGTAIYFTADSPQRTYWRGEALSFYDGRKWTQPYHDAMEMVDVPGALDPLSPGSEPKVGQNGRVITQQINFKDPVHDSLPLFAGGPITNVVNIYNGSGKAANGTIIADSMTGNVKLLSRGNELDSISGYQVQAEVADVDPKRLRQISGGDPESVKERYLQLPNQLPARVEELARRITSTTTNRYDATMAVKSYLESHYDYALDTRVPAEGHDFTDDFLFDQKFGYCNHFSTAMTVMLRSQGIPARYVKGFAPGKKAVDGNEYVVSEGDAHSWVEVYFPQAGWIAFDPTPGFDTGQENDNLALAKPLSRESFGDYVAQMWNSAKDYIWTLLLIAIDQRIPLAGGLAATSLLLLAVRSIWRGRSVLGLWMNVHRPGIPQKRHMLSAAAAVWEALIRHHGAPAPGMTEREYLQSLVITDEQMQGMIRQFAESWEKIAYDETPTGRTASIAFLRQCLKLTDKLV